MSFVFPWALWGLLLVPVLLLAFFFKLQSSRAVVSALHLWEKSTAKDGLLARFHKLRRWLSLLVALLLLALFLAAAARPLLSGGEARDEVHLLVIDRRSEMSAVDAEGVSLFNKARERTIEIVRNTPDDGRTILAAADARLRILGRLGASHKELLGILESLEVTGVAGDLNATAGQALQLLPENSSVLFITSESGKPRIADERLFVEAVGDPNASSNHAIQDFGIKRRLSDPSTLEIFARVTGPDGEVEMDFFVNDSLLEVITLNLPSRGWSRELALADLPETIPEHRFMLRLRDGGAIRFDDSAYAVVPVLEPIRVLLVSGGNRYLEAALAADQSLQVDLLQPDQFSSSMAGSFDVVLLDRLPAGMLADAGNFLWIQPLEEEAELAIITATNPSHSILSQVVLDRARIPALRDVTSQLQETGWESTALVSSQETALVSLATRGDQRLVRFGLDLEGSDLPARVAFPLLIRQSLQWLASPETAEISSLRAGSIHSLEPGETVSLDGAVLSKERYAELLQPGFYSTDTQSLAVSTLPEMHPAVASGEIGPAKIYPRTSTGMDWRWFAGVALLLLALEWWAYHRRQLE